MVKIGRNISKRVLMAGDYYKNSHPGGISAVVSYWSNHIDGLQYYPIYKTGGKLIKGWWFLTSYLRLAFRMAFDKDARIVHLHTAADGSFKRNSQLTGLAKRFGRKVIMHIHASRFKDFYNESEDKQKILGTLQSVDRLIVLSESWKEWFKTIGVAQDKITILHNITPEPTPIPQAKKKDGKVRFLFMGEIGQRKGVFDILCALAAHHEEAAERMELIIGGNKNEQKLLDAIKENRLEGIVRFEGSFNEGLPISILEAMSYGCPIISTPVGGIPEVVNSNGVLVTPGNETEIWSAMERYMKNPSLIESEGSQSLVNVKEYLPDHVMNHLQEIYLQMLDVKE